MLLNLFKQQKGSIHTLEPLEAFWQAQPGMRLPLSASAIEVLIKVNRLSLEHQITY